jgi:hypothetical protein
MLAEGRNREEEMLQSSCKAFALSLILGGLALTSSWAEALGEVTLTNHTDKTLCVYVGNNVLTCLFAPKAEVKLRLPMNVFQAGKLASVSRVMVTNAGGFIDNPDGSKSLSNMTLCQTREFIGTDSKQWQVQEGKEANCAVQPIYACDLPRRMDY